jgi:hypothetical protein
MPKKDEATRKALEHVERARGALEDFRTDAINAEGVVARPRFQLAELKIARAELEKAIAIIERTKW